ncbi:hypothetical protein [Prauserella cavernicola]|uniref:DUF3291 domain-containing protein n=1 Tax=Prauserella cavernicola TaxID=2800127 RepID=A0A934R1M2_9PSEU|nr:hypothetical protein [Prauserella cavernicola]MBK1789424.1 hypothetical protein [Prauserella cavernicola]
MSPLRSGWRAGPVSGVDGPVLVSVTAFTYRHLRDLPGITLAAIRLRREWPELDGAVGLWLWAEPSSRRVGSVSVWTGETALRGFVGVPLHVGIMRRYRDRGEVSASTWWSGELDQPEIWRAAVRWLR